MPTQLTQPTGAQLVPLAPSGAATTLGTLTATQIDLIVAADTDSNPVREAWTHIDGLVGRALTTGTYPFAYRAMIAACRYELLAYDRANQEGIPNSQGGGILIDAYNDKMTRYANSRRRGTDYFQTSQQHQPNGREWLCCPQNLVRHRNLRNLIGY